MKHTLNINTDNVNNIRKQIVSKESNKPHFGTNSSIITDQDHFPYNRYFRGITGISQPVVIEREAGFRDIENNCYSTKVKVPITRPTYCYQTSCSTIFPCTNENKELNQNENNFNKKCNIQYY